MVYGRYTGGIRWYTGDIRGYTQYIVSIAYIGYTGIYGDIRWYTGDIIQGYTGIYARQS